MLEQKNYDREFEKLKANVKKILGFNTFQYKDTYLKRRFNSRLRAHHLDSYPVYLELLLKDKTEQEQLRRDLTINVTEFFRDNSMYITFRDEIIPDIVQKKQGKIRIWSAGSSDGKEAYSIAILAIEVLGKYDVSDRLEIIGTDIDSDILQKAVDGIYESRPDLPQTNIEEQMKFIQNPEKYFDIDDNMYAAKQCIKQLVDFQHHDLISSSKKKDFDVIFCRNVVIYFNRELQEILYKDFYNALNQGGYFIMGKTETLIGESRDLFVPFDSKEKIFIKK